MSLNVSQLYRVYCVPYPAVLTCFCILTNCVVCVVGNISVLRLRRQRAGVSSGAPARLEKVNVDSTYGSRFRESGLRRAAEFSPFHT